MSEKNPEYSEVRKTVWERVWSWYCLITWWGDILPQETRGSKDFLPKCGGGSGRVLSKGFLPGLITQGIKITRLGRQESPDSCYSFPSSSLSLFHCIWAELTAALKRQESTIYLSVKSTIRDPTQPRSWIFRGGVTRKLVMKQKTECQRKETNILIFINWKNWAQGNWMGQWPYKVAVVIKSSTHMPPTERTSSRQFYGLIVLSNFTIKDSLSLLHVVSEMRKSGKGAHLS